MVPDSASKEARYARLAASSFSLMGARSPTSLSDAVASATREGAEALEVERVAVWLFEPDRDAIRLYDLYDKTLGEHTSGEVAKRTDLPKYFAALETQRILSVHDVEADPRTVELAEDYTRPRRIGAMLHGAIRIAGEVAGVVCFEQLGGPRAWDRSDEVFVADFSAHIAQLLVRDERDRALTAITKQSEVLLKLAEAQANALTGHPADLDAWFALTLDALLEFSQSEYGFIGSVFHDDRGEPFLRTHAITNIAWDVASREHYDRYKDSGLEFRNLDTLFGAVLTTRELVIANDPGADLRAGGLPAGHPPMESFAGIPLLRGEEFLGMVGLANRRMGYDESSLGHIQALLSATTTVLGFIRDQEALAEARAHLEASELAIPGMFVVTALRSAEDGGPIVTDCNERFQRRLGYERHQIVGKPLASFYDDASAEEMIHGGYERALKEIYEGVERVLVTRDGVSIPTLLHAVPVHDAGGKTSGTRATFTDISELRAVRQELESERASLEEKVRQRTSELEAANRELARVSRLKDEFLASMSHELRTPLNTILGMSEALAEGAYGALTEVQTSQLTFVHESGRHLLTLINDILDVAKIEAGQVELDLAPVSVSEVVDSALRLVAPAAVKKRISVARSDAPEVDTITADGRRLKQILVNLTSNAVKFTPEGGRVGVDVEGDVEAGMVRIVVWDEGIGISEEEQGRLFESFVQLDAGLSREHAGTGLGLVIARRMTELHGGTLTLESREGEGSRFTVTIPWREASGAGPAAIRSRSGSRRALVADEQDVDSSILMRYLQGEGFEVERTGVDAGLVDRATAANVDVIFLDPGTRDEAGWALLETLSMDPRTSSIPVIVVSVVEADARAKRAGAAASMLKPVSRSDVRSFLSERGMGAADAGAGETTDAEGQPLLGRILLVEDNEQNVRTYASYLRHKGYEVRVAHNGREALEAVRAERPQLVLMDVQMPEMDGLEATRQIRSSDAGCSDVPIIALTALAMRGDERRCLEAGMDGYLSKPVKLKQLIAMIEEHIDRS